MKTRTAIFIMIFGAIIATVGSIWAIDTDSSRYNYPGRMFILQDYMTQAQQTMLGLAMFFSGMGIMLLPLAYPWPWFRKVPCVNCQKNKTRGRNDDNLAICDDCEENMRKQALIDKFKDEDILMCPVDGSKMDKLVLDGTEIVADQCPDCKGTWLSKDEIEELEEDLGRPRSARSFSSGMILGMNVGRMGR